MTVDFTKGLPFEDETFDYVVERLQTIYCSEQSWPKFIKGLMRVTKPGGIIEIRAYTFLFITILFLWRHADISDRSFEMNI